MRNIATLTLNPTLDVSYAVERLVPAQKTRASGERHDPGGGGINVARVFVRLGGNARCFYLSGGATGHALDGLLDLHQILRERIAIAGDTRISTAISVRESGQEYRFVPPGPVIAPEEWQECLDRIAGTQCDYLVASGSLAPGVPEDFYAQVAAIAARRGTRMVLDSSGAGLRCGLEGGNVHLVKPSLDELRQLSGRPLSGIEEIGRAAMDIVEKGQAEIVAVTLSQDGALLARRSGTLHLPALLIEPRSTVGAGDSFLAAMVFTLAGGGDEVEAFRFGIAAGAAALLNTGTSLSQPSDIQRFFPLVAMA
jgi:6-phosphofructokinase 2